MAAEGDYQNLDLVHWLAEMIKVNLCPGLKLIAGSAGKFTIPWKNEKSGGLKSGDDNTLFIEAWAKHKNYPLTNGGYTKDLINWKEKFRNSLNSYVKKGKNIRRLKKEDTDDCLVCQFDEAFLLNNSNLMTHQGEVHTCTSLGQELSSGSFVIGSQSNCPKEILDHCSMGEMDYNTCLSYIEHCADSPICNPAVTTDHTATQGRACEEIMPVLNVSVMYGIPHCQVDSVVLKSNKPACRLFYPSCETPGVKQYLGEDDSVLHYQLPSVDALPEFNKEQKGIILKILDKMDRGLYLRYQSGNVYAERRDAINVFVTSDLHQKFKLSRRKSRRDEPRVHKVFDYQIFLSRLEQYQAKPLNSPPMANIIFHFELSNLGHVVINVTHIKAVEEMNKVLIKGPPMEISSSKEDEMDQLISFLNEAARCDRGLPPDHPAIEAIQNVIPLLEESLGDRSAIPMDTEKSRQIDIPKPPEVPVLMLDVYCDIPSRIIQRKYIHESKTYCRMFSGDCEVLLPCDNFNEENVDALSLQNSVEASDLKIEQKINTILSKLQRGVHVKYDNGDIYVERRCSVNVYITDGVSMSQMLKRRNAMDKNDKFVKAFDYEQFKQSLEEFKRCPVGPLPSYEFKLTFGHAIHSEYSNPMMQILFYVSVHHIQAYQELSTAVGYPNETYKPLQSIPDSIDRILQFVKDLSKGTDDNRS